MMLTSKSAVLFCTKFLEDAFLASLKVIVLMSLQSKHVASRLPKKAFPEGFYPEGYVYKILAAGIFFDEH